MTRVHATGEPGDDRDHLDAPADPADSHGLDLDRHDEHDDYDLDITADRSELNALRGSPGDPSLTRRPYVPAPRTDAPRTAAQGSAAPDADGLDDKNLDGRDDDVDYDDDLTVDRSRLAELRAGIAERREAESAEHRGADREEAPSAVPVAMADPAPESPEAPGAGTADDADGRADDAPTSGPADSAPQAIARPAVPQAVEDAIAEIRSTSTGPFDVGILSDDNESASRRLAARQAELDAREARLRQREDEVLSLEWTTDEREREDAIAEANRVRHADTIPHSDLIAMLQARRERQEAAAAAAGLSAGAAATLDDADAAAADAGDLTAVEEASSTDDASPATEQAVRPEDDAAGDANDDAGFLDAAPTADAAATAPGDTQSVEMALPSLVRDSTSDLDDTAPAPDRQHASDNESTDDDDALLTLFDTSDVDDLRADIRMPMRPRRTTDSAGSDSGAEPRAAVLDARGADRTRRRRRVLRTWLILAGILIVLLGTAAAIAASLVNQVAAQIQTIPKEVVFPESDSAAAVPVAKSGTNILLLGSDTRGSVKSLATSGGDRSDTMMVVNLSGDGKSVTVMSIMRDTWVTIPEYGPGKINSALSTGGVPLAVRTVQEYLGIKIDHVALVDFQGFAGLTDALGGVTVDNPTTFTPEHGDGEAFEKGPLELNGDQALAFVRERYAFDDGDYTRVRNQQAFLRAVLGKLSTSGALTDPGKLKAIVGSLKQYVVVDSGLDVPTMLGIGEQIGSAGAADVQFFTAPTSGTSMVGDQSVVMLDENAWQSVRQAFLDDDLAAYVKSH